jgi:hypothetical protein
MTQRRTDAKDGPKGSPAHDDEEKLDDIVKVEGDSGEIELPREEVIPRLDELAEAVLSEKEPPEVRAPTEENS